MGDWHTLPMTLLETAITLLIVVIVLLFGVVILTEIKTELPIRTVIERLMDQ